MGMLPFNNAFRLPGNNEEKDNIICFIYNVYSGCMSKKSQATKE
jgi:hypothetical protein